MTDRAELLDRLRTDLIGPYAEHEEISARPSDLYLTGILWPKDPDSKVAQAEADDALSSGLGADEESTENEEIRASAIDRPRTAGISFALEAGSAPAIDIDVRFALYTPIEEEPKEPEKTGRIGAPVRWKRLPCEFLLEGVKCSPGIEEKKLPAPAPEGVSVYVRSLAHAGGLLVTVTLVNRAEPDGKRRVDIEKKTLFQTSVTVRPSTGSKLSARPSRRKITDDDSRSAALLYRDAHEYAVGHTCGADWTAPADNDSGSVRTAWIPSATVAAISADGHTVFEALRKEGDNPFSASWLSTAATAPMCSALARLPKAYRDWIALQRGALGGVPGDLLKTAEQHLKDCDDAADAISECVNIFQSSPAAAEAFRLANEAMARQFAWSAEDGAALSWRPFQLAFVMMSIPSLIDRKHPARRTMDLLWFPTGGGKTEAYLALIAFLAFYRRLSSGSASHESAGVAAIMRYTLRLLTTQQFDRASAVVLACDLIRRRDVARFGRTPFSIGLWVGSDATPNRYADAAESLRRPTFELASPKQLVSCPACAQKLSWRGNDALEQVEVRCTTEGCELKSDAPLPVWTVDEDVYRARPTLLIGTVDKFAQIVRGTAWRPLLGLAGGSKPDLIIQDELHLVSGPLGTITGLYEAAIDRILETDGAPPKVIGSTATIRRADDQILAVFDRRARLFPSPGLVADDSGFAVRDTARPGRLYAAVTTAGRSAKFALQAASASLLQSGEGAFGEGDGDPYMTLVAYFNSLRELGGALVLMQDDVGDSIGVYSAVRGETARAVTAVEELTSRRSQTEVREMLDSMKLPLGDPGMLDVVLASNMLSVGVDVQRLGLMLVNGQPKGIAEYIQATSRIGRSRKAPGLVVAVLNNAKARDRSHYETFRTWHETLYRDVEATSVTPFAARARDRALHAVVVALVRSLTPGMADRPNLANAQPENVRALRDWIAKRADHIDPSETDVRAELDAILEEWERRAPQFYWNDWRPNLSLVQSAERAATRRANGREPGAAWPTMNNMRSVEASTHFRLAETLRPREAKGAPDGQ